MPNVRVDFSRVTGPVKPMHGVNNGPVTGGFQYDATNHFRDAAIPFSRLHDTEYPFGSGEYVDVACIFKNFDADENDPASYNFALTDLYLQKILDAGAKIIYRLGATIEHQPIKRHIFPPKDYAKWVRVCEHIIRHINEGWADGHHMGVEYWEIWNEPDIPQCWTGTPEQYFDLYVTASKHLKQCFPNLKIGGPTTCNPFSDYVNSFLTWIQRENAPLDFCSWHLYGTDPALFAKGANTARELCVSHGYPDAEIIIDEWNYVENWAKVGESFRVMRTAHGTAFYAATMLDLAASSCDIATFYDAQMMFSAHWNPIFAPIPAAAHGMVQAVATTHAFDAFLAYAALYRLGRCAEAVSDAPVLRVLAATDGRKAALMLVNYDASTDAPLPVTLTGAPRPAEALLSDASARLRTVCDYADETFTLPLDSILLLKYEL